MSGRVLVERLSCFPNVGCTAFGRAQVEGLVCLFCAQLN